MRAAPCLVALFLALPLAAAAWNPTLLTEEPSAPEDTPDVMFWDAPLDPAADRVYLDVRHVAVSAQRKFPHLEAVFAVWRDCNHDRIMGDALGETYASLLLPASTLCPVGGRHNDGTLVREILWIGPGAPAPHYDDPDARVWADASLPGAAVAGPKLAVDDVLEFDAVSLRWIGVKQWLTPPPGLTAYAFYDSVDLPQLVPPSPGTHIYGLDQCPTSSGLSMGWVCDPQAWQTGVTVGHPYQLRDTD